MLLRGAKLVGGYGRKTLWHVSVALRSSSSLGVQHGVSLVDHPSTDRNGPREKPRPVFMSVIEVIIG
ncbi:hypothetical protein J1614_010078 [Plenodomus biglobosus]|nr:hypothetical protein J1614_010078 [Plenodomus biglobosus]